jgi:crotonobetainyl-CoA:carnitine CoA-transferase CaiB-like acyl-CoA transferase
MGSDDYVLLPLPSVFRVGAAASGAVVAAHREAAALLAARLGAERRAVSVDPREAFAAFRSERYLRLDGKPIVEQDPLTADYETSDGWIRLHCNFGHHAAIACRVLGVAPTDATRETVAAAVAGRGRYELEDAITTAGGVAAAMRTREEWAAHPHSSVVAGRIATSAAYASATSTAAPMAMACLGERGVAERSPRWMEAAERPLAGVRVLDLTRIIAGPVAGRVLAGYGAEVTMVRAEHLPTIASLDLDTGFGKTRRSLDLRTAEGRDTFLALVRASDVVLQSYRPGALAKLGLGPEDLAAVRPGLVHVSVSAYGMHGPWAGKRGFDSLVQMATGIADEQMRAFGSDRPVPLPAQVLDHAAGWTAAAGAIRALRNRSGDRASWTVAVSLAGMAHWVDGLGRVDPAAALAAPDPTFDDVRGHLQDTPTAAGLLTHVRMPGAIDGVELGWDRPPPV